MFSKGISPDQLIQVKTMQEDPSNQSRRAGSIGQSGQILPATSDFVPTSSEDTSGATDDWQGAIRRSVRSRAELLQAFGDTAFASDEKPLDDRIYVALAGIGSVVLVLSLVVLRDTTGDGCIAVRVIERFLFAPGAGVLKSTVGEETQEGSTVITAG